MNLRHAAALALLGWYLMMPQLTEKPPPHATENDLVDTSAPLSQWTNLRSFDLASQCNWMLDHLADKYTKKVGQNDHSGKEIDDAMLRTYAGYARIKRSKCISTDDPRLKGK